MASLLPVLSRWGTPIALALMLLGVAAPARAAEHNGFNLHPLWGSATPAQYDRELELAQAAGADTVRIDLSWSTLESDGKGQHSSWYVAKADAFLADAAARGIRVVATFWSTPCWASSAPSGVKQSCSGAWWDRGVQDYPPTNATDYADAAAWVANRWGGELAGLELWNEPNNSTFFNTSDQAGHYAALVKAAYASIKAARPALPVVAGSLVWADRHFLASLYDDGIAGDYDAISIHPYDDATLESQTGDAMYSLARGVPALRQTMLDRGDSATPLWLTELGWPTCPASTFRWCVSQDQQAQDVHDAFAAIGGWPYVSTALVYELRDEGTDSGDFQQNMGLVENDFTPKPAYDAFAQAIAPPAAVAAPPAPPPASPPPATGPNVRVLAPRIAAAWLRRQVVTVSGAIAYVRVTSDGPLAGTVTLRATVRGARARRVVLGHASFSFAHKGTRRVAVRLSRAARTLLARRHRLGAVATVATRGRRGGSSAPVTLAAHRS